MVYYVGGIVGIIYGVMHDYDTGNGFDFLVGSIKGACRAEEVILVCLSIQAHNLCIV